MRQEINATATPDDFDLLEDWIEVRYLDTRTVLNPDFDPDNPTDPPTPEEIDEEFHVESAEFRALLDSNGDPKSGENYGKIVARVRTGMDFRTGKKSPPALSHAPPKRPDHPVNVP